MIVDVTLNTFKSTVTVGGRAAIQQSAGLGGQRCFQLFHAGNMAQNHIGTNAEGHESKLGIAASIQNGITDRNNCFLHVFPLFVHRVGSVDHYDHFVMTRVTVFTGNIDCDFITIALTVNAIRIFLTNRLNIIGVRSFCKCLHAESAEAHNQCQNINYDSLCYLSHR